jgi:hypothetical protein
MTLHSTTAAALLLPRDSLFCIGRWHAGGEATEFEMTHGDHDRDTAWATEVLRGLGLGRGDVLLAVTRLCEAPWNHAFTTAAGVLGATVAHADCFGWDAGRVEMFARRLPVRVALGVPGEVASTLVERDLLGSLAAVPTILARPDAVAALRGAGLSPGVLAQVGPALAVATDPAGPLIYNTDEWLLSDGDPVTDRGELLVTTVGARAARLERAPTGMVGRVAGPGRITLAAAS